MTNSPFTDFLESLETPLYEAKGKKPKCKEGYKWDDKIGGCIPIGSKSGNKEPEKKDMSPVNSYDEFVVWGSNGMDGGYALEEPNNSDR